MASKEFLLNNLSIYEINDFIILRERESDIPTYQWQ